MDFLLIALIAFAACFTQTLSGFGSALVAMPILIPLLGSAQALPLMVLIAGLLQLVLLAKHHRNMSFRSIWPIMLTSTLAVYPGMVLTDLAPKFCVLGILGLLVLFYAIYSLSSPTLPRLRGQIWGVPVGLLSGILGGAYATNGPPLIVYGACKRWEPQEFKANLQALFLVNNLVIMLCCLFKGSVNLTTIKYFLAALPGIATGIILALLLDNKIGKNLFRKLVLWMLIGMGSLLIINSARMLWAD
jgi:uncharacterized protein